MQIALRNEVKGTRRHKCKHQFILSCLDICLVKNRDWSSTQRSVVVHFLTVTSLSLIKQIMNYGNRTDCVTLCHNLQILELCYELRVYLATVNASFDLWPLNSDHHILWVKADICIKFEERHLLEINWDYHVRGCDTPLHGTYLMWCHSGVDWNETEIDIVRQVAVVTLYI